MVKHVLCAMALWLLPQVCLADGRHGFDAEFGVWNVRVSRLTHAPSGRATWVTYTGTHTVTPLWNGRANIGVLEIHGAAGRIEGLQLRLYDPATDRWSLSFANSADGALQPPMVGGFRNGIGDFRDAATIDGKRVLERAISTPLTPRSYRDVIARSYDGGKSWTTVWIATYDKRAR